MGMYTRKDYEQDMEVFSLMRTSTTRKLLSGEINGFQKMRMDANIEQEEQRAWNRLQGTRLRLIDADEERKHQIRVRTDQDENLFRFSAGEWVPTNEWELMTLEDKTGKTIRHERKKHFHEYEEWSTANRPAPTRVSREEGRAAQQRGELVRFNEDDSAEIL